MTDIPSKSLRPAPLFQQLWSVAALLLVAGAVRPGGIKAQVPERLPANITPQEAARVLRGQAPGEVVRRKIRESGLSPNEIRARLRAAGYPSGLLDAYFGPDEILPPPPRSDMVQVISMLGISSFTRRDSLLVSGDTVAIRLLVDSLRADSIAVADSLAELSRELELFGMDVFRQATTQFQPLVTGPVDDAYILGPGDVLALILTGDVELAHTLEVTRGGFVVIPQVGQIPVNSLTLGEFKSLLADRLRRSYSGIRRDGSGSTKFHVTVASVRVHTVRVIGEVARPGAYQLAATGTILTALYEAGGLTERGNFRAVEVRRGSELVAAVDLYDYLLHGTITNDVPLAPGDVIFVPVRGPRVKVAGEVTRPGIYELKPGETLADLVEVAGGLTPEAATEAVTIDRIVPPEQRVDLSRARTVMTVNLADQVRLGSNSIPMLAGDSVHVFSVRGVRRNSVAIRGSVWQEGTYELEPGMRLSDLFRMAGGLRPETYEGRVQVLRTNPDSTQFYIGVPLVPQEPEGTDGPVQGGLAFDPVLQELDVVTVFPRTEFRAEHFVAVHGAVRRTGIVAYADSMTLRDALLLAGGLREDASLLYAEVSRLADRDSERDSLATVLRVPLDSTYLFDRASGRGSSAGRDVILQPYDNVFVRTQPDWDVPQNVVLTGEVRFPGRYTLLHKDERLTSVLQRAGGLTPQAYANGIRFFRVVGAAGRIGVNLPEVLEDVGHRDNLALVAGDSIHIPRFIPTVRVEGQVNSPASVPHVPRAGVRYYVNAAGGFTQEADKGGTFVQQPNGLIEKGEDPEPGATVFVPQEDPDDRGFDLVSLLSNLAQIVAATATVIVVLTR